MYWYNIYGMVIESDFLLDGVHRIDALPQSDLIVCKGVEKENSVFATKPLDSEDDYLYTCHKQFAAVNRGDDADFIVENGNRIVYYLKDGYNRERVKQAIVFMCLLIARAQLGLISLHGSCVVVNGKAYMISGESGAGKSTFASGILLNYDAKFLSDDVCAITFKDGCPYVEPAIAERKLCNNTAIQFGYDISKLKKLEQIEKEKYILNQYDRFIEEGKALGGIIIIEPKDCQKVILQECEGNEKFKEIMNCVFHKNMFLSIGNAKAMFDQCNQIIKTIPVYRLERPNNCNSEQEMLDVFNELISNETIVS